MQELPISPPPVVRPAVNFRSVLLGLAGTSVICGLTAYNDYAMRNTLLVGNNLPLGVVLLTFLFVLGVNGPLSRWRPRWAFHSGELCVALSMMLIACCLPGGGLMRYLPSSLTGPLWQSRSHSEFRSIFLSLNLPDWLWPQFSSDDRRTWSNDPVVTGFHARWIQEGPIPLTAWIRPAITWGIFLAAMYGAVMCLMLIVRRQWVDNERLPFPLAQIQLAMIETPRRGQWLNSTFRSRGFWIAFGCVFLLHGWNGLAKYFPEFFPTIWTYYDFSRIFTEPPFAYMDQKVKDAAIFFTVVGVTYFLSSSVAFSLWAFFLLFQVFKMMRGSFAGDASTPGQGDQHLGGLIAFAVATAWIGRHHWMMVAKQAVRGQRDGEPEGVYLSYRKTAWALISCVVIMIGWLVLAGAGLGGAVVMVMLLLFLFVMIARIIAEVGLVHGQLQVPIYKPFGLLAAYGVKMPVSMETYYHAAMLQSVHYDFREVSSVYGLHALRMADQTIDPSPKSGQGRRFLACLALALIVGYVISFASLLIVEYTYSATLSTPSIDPINEWGARDNPRWMIVEPTVQYDRQQYYMNHSPLAHMTFGFIFTGILSFLRLRFTGWPLHPIGFLMINTYPGAHLWFSIMIGWALKSLVVRFGGAGMYSAGKPVALGLIVGEAMAAGFWLCLGILLNAMNLPYKPISIMPG
ncbi:MAG TPA: DUF6785 family protein [Tepidisphaeraceae bacterium]|nr:DUF6785 family protein [Tepidisphaeraceae bacterium]